MVAGVVVILQAGFIKLEVVSSFITFGSTGPVAAATIHHDVFISIVTSRSRQEDATHLFQGSPLAHCTFCCMITVGIEGSPSGRSVAFYRNIIGEQNQPFNFRAVCIDGGVSTADIGTSVNGAAFSCKYKIPPLTACKSTPSAAQLGNQVGIGAPIGKGVVA